MRVYVNLMIESLECVLKMRSVRCIPQFVGDFAGMNFKTCCGTSFLNADLSGKERSNYGNKREKKTERFESDGQVSV